MACQAPFLIAQRSYRMHAHRFLRYFPMNSLEHGYGTYRVACKLVPASATVSNPLQLGAKKMPGPRRDALRVLSHSERIRLWLYITHP